MFIAMNRFKIVAGFEAAFEAVWVNRESLLDTVPGFVSFNLLKGPAPEGYVLYATHTVWQDRGVFEDWTKSEAFRAAHRNAGDNRGMYQGHPELELFEAVETAAR
jgi:heme-degrading monooxygenase HmoA